MSDEQVKRRNDEFLTTNQMNARQPTEEELYWKRMAQGPMPPGAFRRADLGDQPNLTAYDREMNALRESVAKLSMSMPERDRRIAELEMRAKRLEFGAELLSQSTTEAVHRLDEKLDAFFEFDEDDQRKDRWHETYNHSRATAFRDNLDSDEEYAARLEKHHLAAVDAADRAHGPLENKLRPGAFDQTEALRGAKLDGPVLFHGLEAFKPPKFLKLYDVDEVDALVRAAAVVVTQSFHNTSGGFWELSDANAQRLDAALKPFKRSE